MKRLFGEFKEFAIRGSVVDLAIGIIVGAGFTALVNSLVKNIVLPPIGLLLNKVDFSNLFISLSGQDFDTLAEAQQAGAPTLNYGLFIDELITFTITALVVFFAVRWVNRLRRKKEVKDEARHPTKECPYCFSTIDERANRCPQCTSELT